MWAVIEIRLGQMNLLFCFVLFWAPAVRREEGDTEVYDELGMGAVVGRWSLRMLGPSVAF